MARVFYRLPDHAIRYANDQKEIQTYSLKALSAFMYYVLEREKLTIADFLEQMGSNPYFLLAATGLGKTVAAPIHSYLRHCERVLKGIPPGRALFNQTMPRLWVVEPKISIAEAQTVFMNELFADFIRQRPNPKTVSNPTLFGCKTSVQTIHYHSPIKFVTTGIFAIFARLGWLDPKRDCILIDEAHVTIESSEGVELAIAICRNLGIPVHYMSATVDTTGLQATLGVQNIIEADKQRYPIWMHNIGHALDASIVDLVEKTLVHPDPTSAYFPQGNDNVSRQIRDAVLETGRAKGLLAVVNSFAGEASDANKLAELLRAAPFAEEIEILLLASAVIRNLKEKQVFDDKMKEIEQRKKKYVIIATSVVEMGITYPTLDFVVTMDSGYEQITIGDTVLPEVVPLPVNSLKQRIGRVGRKRPGIGYISNEVGAAYTQLNDIDLNGRLPYEQIGLPLQRGSLTLVAQYSFKQEWPDPVQGLVQLNLPSGIHRDQKRVQEFLRQRQRLIDLGIAVDNRLTEEGKYCERWLDANVDLGYAIRLQEAMREHNETDMYFYLIACALSNVSIGSFKEKSEISQIINLPPGTDRTRNTNGDRARRGIELRKRTIEFTPQSEILALYNIMSYMANRYSAIFVKTNKITALEKAVLQLSLASDCQAMGINPDQIGIIIKGFATILKTFHDTNYRREEYISLFGERRELRITDITFPELIEWDIRRFMAEISRLPNRTRIILTQSFSGFSWKEENGDRTGTIRQDTTSVVLHDKQIVTAKLIPLPGNQNRKAGEAWRVVHLQHDLKK